MAQITPTSIANRALQRVGAQRIGVVDATKILATEVSKNASEIRACYDNLRRAELRRNVWTFAVRRAVLRPYQTASNIVNSGTPAMAGITQAITFGTFNIATTYVQSDVVTGSDGQVYLSLKGANIGNDPTLATSFPYWTLYFGADVAQEYVTAWSASITYAIGNNVIGSDGLSYQSVVNTNLNHNPVGDGGAHWVAGGATATKNSPGFGYYAGELVYVGAKLYLSLVNANTVDPTTNVDVVSGLTYTNSWMTMTTAPTLSALNFIYPIGAGPLSNPQTRNVYRLPVGYMREAPQMPKQGSYSIMGAPSNLPYTDWEYDDNYILSSGSGPLIYRFVADVQDTTRFDSLFAEGFACRIALEICEPLTQSTAKLQAIGAEYKGFMGEARIVNAVEQGPVESPLDDFISVRY